MTARRILAGLAEGPVLAMTEGLSFWGGVDPQTARVIDAHHPAHGAGLAGAVVMMPTSRGSCSGSGVMLDLMLNGRAPAALVFSEPEDILTLGALIGAEMFSRAVPVLRVSAEDFAHLSVQPSLRIGADAITGEGISVPIKDAPASTLALTAEDQTILNGRDGEAAALAMRIVCAMARQQGAERLTGITRGHMDGTLLAHPANLIFAEKMAELGAKVRVPTTINAISVDRENWPGQGVDPDFGARASRLADAYVQMGCRPSFTCAPYLLTDRPQAGEDIAWAESNAVVFANTVLGARTPKHPDYLDLCMAVTGRAPLAGVYLEEARRPALVLDVEAPEGADDSFWPLLGYVAGHAAGGAIPLLRGLAGLNPTTDDLKAMCAAFGTTSGAPMLHVEGVTPEAHLPPLAHATQGCITRADLSRAWAELNQGPEAVDLVAIGSPHASAPECRALADLLNGPVSIPLIVTAGRAIIAELDRDGTLKRLKGNGVQVFPDLCWCSITEPVFPPQAQAVMTNSGKYAHYGPGLSGRALRFGSLADCARAARTGNAAAIPPWLT
ncbi:aconitase family protein [Paracoccus sp. (in: a-proteobacteria)]|uniref:cis-3-hydroxy-L-proline dehydratase n=1 Tax=Paracoccus sp. TaxID=267 RepID=UPI0026DF7026|nr:aconitase family protein [Paracoccus sp. (in: a-proteobacteria)]MDO5371386.1 aconitase family protein [Paracoccus sp. (in: a-proteobacteria)]